MNKLRYRIDSASLAARLTATIALLVIVAIALVTIISLQREQETFQRELEHQAQLLTNTLAAAAADPLYKLDTDFLSSVVKGLRADESILSGRIYDSNGRIVADAYSPENRFRLEPDPLGRRVLQSQQIVFEWKSDRLVAGRAIRVGQTRVGALSISLSTAPLAAKTATVRNQGLLAAGAVAAIGMAVVMLFSRSISKPLLTLTQATQQLAAGDFEQRIQTGGGRELILLGESFNRMAQQLRDMLAQQKQQQNTLTATNQELEQSLAEVTQAHRVQDELQQTIREMSLPVLSVAEHILLLPLIGSLDSGRSKQLMERLLGEVGRQQARYVILDVSGVPVIDTQVASALLRVTQATQLLGARAIVCGITPEVAEVIVGLGINTDAISVQSNLHAALSFALESEGRSILSTEVI